MNKAYSEETFQWTSFVWGGTLRGQSPAPTPHTVPTISWLLTSHFLIHTHTHTHTHTLEYGGGGSCGCDCLKEVVAPAVFMRTLVDNAHDLEATLRVCLGLQDSFAAGRAQGDLG